MESNRMEAPGGRAGLADAVSTAFQAVKRSGLAAGETVALGPRVRHTTLRTRQLPRGCWRAGLERPGARSGSG